jgi:hypothetical protein
VKALAQLGRQLIDFIAFIDGNSLTGGVENYLAMLAARGVNADFLLEFGAELVVEVIGKMAEKVGAVHAG